jgi:hypothetical protein
MVLTQADLELLKQLMGAGERGRTIRALATLQRLARRGYVTSRAGGNGLVNYRITRLGRDAIVEHDAS